MKLEDADPTMPVKAGSVWSCLPKYETRGRMSKAWKTLRGGHPTDAVTLWPLPGGWDIVLHASKYYWGVCMCASMHVRTWKTLKVNKQTNMPKH